MGSGRCKSSRRPYLIPPTHPIRLRPSSPFEILRDLGKASESRQGAELRFSQTTVFEIQEMAECRSCDEQPVENLIYSTNFGVPLCKSRWFRV